MHQFFRNNKNKDFFGGYVPLKSPVYTVVVVYLDGYKKEYQGIEHPWKYISKVKKNPKVKSCYIQ